MPQEQLTIRDAETARLLVERKQVRLLAPFTEQPQTLSETAWTLGVKLPLLHYHAKRFLAHGLLEVVGTKLLEGRAVKRYQSSAKAFFIPFDLTPSETLAGLLGEISAAAEANFQRAASQALLELAPLWGLRWNFSEGGEVYYEMLPETAFAKETLEATLLAHGAPAFLSFHDGLELEYDTAKALQIDLIELTKRYGLRQTPGAGRYAFHMGLAPAAE